MKVDSIDTGKIATAIGWLKGITSNSKSGAPLFPPAAKHRADIEEAIQHIEGATNLVRRTQREHFKTRSKGNKNKKPFPREATIKLAQCVITTLNTGGKLGVGSGMLVTRNAKTNKLEFKPWADDLFDALEAIGIEYDREAYYAEVNKKRRR